ncbi:aldo/keto reductase [Helicobacter saguini]|uniref:Aldo/keto reductase n=2 Tax=Helicobacter saguini TaxID=1548018 RepID=A0A347VTW1_9HELI|nr:aldo/keto reductase [Helicobacter saguini]MWV61449.1 aldo/keto reductase [Helicobacter saguini]MWV67880.1 aldo/keto reductase [Helicobacter saguini]MWV70651.1 aldo/keto reductase [Helicobacter saguini]MWV72556.1 aldo/keto reductase [Helicobacter saguini]TLD94824.1 aldo/keto reductase [Helicobacter saguini]
MEYITLNNGVKMPLLGYGTYQIDNKDVQKCVEDAISVGYRSIDTAAAYFNESGIGAALKNAQSSVKRADLFITTKLWINEATESKALKAFERSLKNLGLDYLDLYLIHQPYNDTYGAWRAMSRLLKDGRIKAIGVSNFYPDRLLDFCLHNEITPAVNQVECHPFFAKFAEQEQMQKLNVAMQSWASFAEGRNDFFKNPTLAKIAKKHGKSIAQVTLRWLTQRGIIVIPKTTKKERMIENFNVFDFKLDSADMKTIAGLDSNKTLFLNHADPKTVEFLSNIHNGKF